MKKIRILIFIYGILFSLASNSYLLISADVKWLFAIIPIFVFINLFAGFFALDTKTVRLKMSHHGAVILSSFCVSIIISVFFFIVLAFYKIPHEYMDLVWGAVFCFISHLILFWVGIICVYTTSIQLGIKQRLIGALCGMVPIVNLVLLKRIIKTVFKETRFEAEKEKVNKARKKDEICKTKYPILFVHGVLFRDYKYLNYWGRIPGELIKNGATVYYGNHHSASSIADSAKELSERIKSIVSEMGCEKVNIIAHSKGGLDCRFALDNPEIRKCVASLTTINTPHKGCLFADYILSKAPVGLKDKVANTYNSALKKLGESNPDFLAAMNNLTASYCTKLDKELKLPEGVFCQSIGTVLSKASGGKFPLNFSYHLAKYFDGENDGLVSEKSFPWGQNYIHLTNKQKRGISHGDIIDLNRENIDGFDVREFYVSLVSNLKNKGF